jgi:hypothetical protein
VIWYCHKMWYVLWYIWCMQWSYFIMFHYLHVDEFTTDRSHMVVFIILYDLLFVVEAIMVEWWRSCRRARDGDQCAKIGYTMSHIVYACDFYPLCILFCFDSDGSIIRWSLTLNFKIKCVLPSYAPIRAGLPVGKPLLLVVVVSSGCENYLKS